MRRPTLAECLGVSSRWQAFAVLRAVLAAHEETVSLAFRVPSSCLFTDVPESSLRSEARYLLWLTDAGYPVISVSAPVAAFYRMLAWELLAELRERRARARR